MYSPSRGEDPPLSVTVTMTEGVVWVQVCGETDLSNSEQLRSLLAEIELAPSSPVCLDLSGLTFCDSAGCRVLLRFETEATATGHDVRIHGASPTLRKVMSIVGATEDHRHHDRS
jgi:anti-anti-sigma factor